MPAQNSPSDEELEKAMQKELEALFDSLGELQTNNIIGKKITDTIIPEW